MTTDHAAPLQLGPVQPQERVILLDVLRAVAILGMFYANFGGGFAAPEPGTFSVGGFQGILSNTILVLTLDKFWPLFAILMGVGMAVQMERVEARGTDVFPTYLRRVLFLYVFGVLASLILWVGALVSLAMAGLVALFIAYPLRKRRLLLLGLVVWLFLGDAIPAAIRASERSLSVMTVEQIETSDQREIERHLDSVDRAGEIRSPFMSKEHVQSNIQRRLDDGFPREFKTLRDLASSASPLLPFMLFGFFLWQIGILRKSWEHKRTLVYLLLISGVVGIVAVFGDEVLSTRSGLARRGIGDPLTPFLNTTESVLSSVAPYSLDLAYISLVALLLPTKWLGGILRKMAPAGRMAFSNYILHYLLPSVLFPLLFAWWLPETGAAENHLKVTGVFILLVVFSTWWLKRFRFGPFEWLWRSLTYWKLQPIRVRTSNPTT